MARLMCILAFLALAPLVSVAEPSEAEEAATEPVEGTAAKDASAGEDTPVDYQAQGQELMDKMAQLRKLIEAKGDSVRPEEAEKLKSLEKMLGSITGTVTGGGKAASDPEVTEFFASCVALAMRRAGAQRPSTLAALRRMADGKMTPEQASESELWLLATSCITRLTDAELAKFKAGSLKTLPKDHTDASKTPDMVAEVLKLEQGHFDEFIVVAKSLVGEREEVAPASPVYGFIAAVPLLGLFGLLVKKVLDLQQEGQTKREKADKKKEKKGK